MHSKETPSQITLRRYFEGCFSTAVLCSASCLFDVFADFILRSSSASPEGPQHSIGEAPPLSRLDASGWPWAPVLIGLLLLGTAAFRVCFLPDPVEFSRLHHSWSPLSVSLKTDPQDSACLLLDFCFEGVYIFLNGSFSPKEQRLCSL